MNEAHIENPVFDLKHFEDLNVLSFIVLNKVDSEQKKILSLIRV